MSSMKDVAQQLEGEDVEDLDASPDPSNGETGENQQVQTGSSVLTKAKDIFLSDTSTKPLENYKPEEYGLPDTDGSKRVIRATDTLLKDNLETVITDYLLGFFDIYKNKGSNEVTKDAVGEAATPE